VLVNTVVSVLGDILIDLRLQSCSIRRALAHQRIKIEVERVPFALLGSD
jgi:hypothetical protein